MLFVLIGLVAYLYLPLGRAWICIVDEVRRSIVKPGMGSLGVSSPTFAQLETFISHCSKTPLTTDSISELIKPQAPLAFAQLLHSTQ